MDREALQRTLNTLGGEGVLDALIALNSMGWCTASELADVLDIHVATAVKRLVGLHDIGFLEKRHRRGKTRGAQEYRVKTERMTVDIDLAALSGSVGGDCALELAILRDMAQRLAKFTGGAPSAIVDGWVAGVEDPAGLLDSVLGKDATPEVGREYASKIINDILELEAKAYGELTVRSLARAAADAISNGKNESIRTISRFFGGI